jgi:PAS domain S-box-containing protein
MLNIFTCEKVRKIMERLCKLLMENEMWIEKKTYELASEKGTIDWTSEHKQKQSEVIKKFVSIISEAMVQKINSMGNIRYEEDRKIPFSAMSFIILQIQVHIDKSVELRHFIWFEKCLRRSYVYFVKYFVSDINLKSKYMLFAMDFFDDLETEIFVQWDKCREKKIVESLKKEDNYDYFANNQDEYTKMNDILKDSEAKFKTLTESTAAAIFINDGNYFSYVNPAAQKMTGYSREEFCNLTMFDLLDEEYYDIIKSCTMTEDGDENTSRYEVKITNKLGKKIWLDVSAGVVYFDGRNQLIISAFDVTKNKETELKLIKSEKQYHQLVELSPDAIFVKHKGELLLTNAAGIKLLGASSLNAVIGKRLRDFLEGSSSNGSCLFKEIASDNKTEEYPFIERKLIRKSDGNILDIEASPASCLYNGINATMLFCRDISERRRMDEFIKNADETRRLLNEAVEYDKLKTEFFSNISHELRTPINVILGIIQLSEYYYKNNLVEDNIKKMEKYNEIMKQNCYRLVRLVNNLIDITKIDSGYLPICLKNCDIVSYVEDITLSVKDYIESKGINMVFDTDVEEKVLAYDADKIERIILNLISNAIKYTKQGGSIFVKINDQGDSIVISVRDTGIGIPEDKQKLVFERFVQVDKSLSRNREGSGIGLSLVKSLTQMHGGEVWLKSTYGVGSEFFVKLPVRLVDDDGTADNSANLISNEKIEKIKIEFSDIY